jgi:VCBS repeat-containing protein
VTLTLTNDPASNQSFASAQVTVTDVTSVPARGSATTSAAGWSVGSPTVSGTTVTWLLTSTGTTSAVVPGRSLPVVLTVGAAPGTTSTVTTQVKQSNDFRGTNNDFAGTPAGLSVGWTAPPGTACTGTCAPTYTSSVNGVAADLTLTSTAPFSYVAGFTTTRLSCDTAPFGATVTPEPFQVETTGTTGVSKTLRLTFPKALANLVPDNGTPHLPVCAGADLAFPGSTATSGARYPHEGLLLDCTDPTYVQQAGTTASPLPMCVAARARLAGGALVLTVTVTVDPARPDVDPMVW